MSEIDESEKGAVVVRIDRPFQKDEQSRKAGEVRRESKDGKNRFKDIAKSLFVLANLVAGTLVFVQLLNHTINRFAFIICLSMTFTLYYSAIKLL